MNVYFQNESLKELGFVIEWRGRLLALVDTKQGIDVAVCTFGFEKDRISFEEASVQAEEWLEYLLREDSEN